VSTIVDIHTRISDLYSSPYDQIAEQIRLTIETVKERQESELINNADYGMLASAAPRQRISTLAGPPTFVLDGYRPKEVASALDQQGIAVRAGHHCAQPILRRYGLESAVRPSLAMYNTCGEADILVSALRSLAADARGHRTEPAPFAPSSSANRQERMVVRGRIRRGRARAAGLAEQPDRHQYRSGDSDEQQVEY
jgi:hypothetical protein